MKNTKYHTDGKVTKSKRKNHRNKGKMELNQLICHILHIVYLIVSWTILMSFSVH